MFSDTAVENAINILCNGGGVSCYNMDALEVFSVASFLQSEELLNNLVAFFSLSIDYKSCMRILYAIEMCNLNVCEGQRNLRDKAIVIMAKNFEKWLKVLKEESQDLVAVTSDTLKYLLLSNDLLLFDEHGRILPEKPREEKLLKLMQEFCSSNCKHDLKSYLPYLRLDLVRDLLEDSTQKEIQPVKTSKRKLGKVKSIGWFENAVNSGPCDFPGLHPVFKEVEWDGNFGTQTIKNLSIWTSSEPLGYIESCHLAFDDGSSKVFGQRSPNSTEETLIVPKGEHISVMQGYRLACRRLWNFIVFQIKFIEPKGTNEV